MFKITSELYINLSQVVKLTTFNSTYILYLTNSEEVKVTKEQFEELKQL